MALLLAASAAWAQERTLTIQNLAPHPRQEWVAVAVPFARGTVREMPELHVQGHPTVWQPFGARWPDGSLRHALCMVPVRIDGLAEQNLPLQAGAGPALPAGDFPSLAPRLEAVVVTGGVEHRAAPVFVRMLEENGARRVGLFAGRVGPTGLVVELILTAWRGQEHLLVDVAVFFSDPETKAMERALELLAIETRGMGLALRHARPFGIESEARADGTRVVLLRNSVLGDGQGLRRSGILAPARRGDGSLRDRTLEAAALVPILGATRWAGSGAYGAFGFVPEVPAWLGGGRLRQAFAARHAAFVGFQRSTAPDPFRDGEFGLARNAGQTGDQADFGVVRLTPVAATGLPSFLLEVELSALQEACRPVHFFEADATPVRAAAHPDWVVWSGRTHWHPGVSKDRLGKPVPEPNFQTHGWGGKDRQHWSSNHLAGFALLTGAWWARRELEHEVQLFLAGETVREGLSTSFPDAPRAVGRTMLAGCWLYLVTGDEELLRRMHDRVDSVYLRHWRGRDLPADRVRPMDVGGPDARQLDGKSWYWNPWQDALAAIGLEGFHRVSGNANARMLAKALALGVTRYGWQLRPDGTAQIATALRWQEGGIPPTPEQLAAGKEFVVWADGTGFAEWAIGAVELARHFAEEDKDDALRQHAEEILRRVRTSRTPPRDGWFDRFADWDAVRK